MGIDLHTSTTVVRCRADRYHILRDVDTYRHTLLVDVREVVLGLLGRHVGDIEIDKLLATDLQLVVYRASHDITRRKRLHRVVLLHKLLAVLQTQYRSVATHRFGDEERRALARIVEGGRVELYILHILDTGLGTVAHRYAIACSDLRVGCGVVDVSATARCYDRELCQSREYLVCLGVEDVGSKAGQTSGVACYNLAEMVLREQIYGKVVLQNRDVGVSSSLLNQRSLNLGTRKVLIVEYAVLGVAALTMEVEAAILTTVEACAPTD